MKHQPVSLGFDKDLSCRLQIHDRKTSASTMTAMISTPSLIRHMSNVEGLSATVFWRGAGSKRFPEKIAIAYLVAEGKTLQSGRPTSNADALMAFPVRPTPMRPRRWIGWHGATKQQPGRKAAASVGMATRTFLQSDDRG